MRLRLFIVTFKILPAERDDIATLVEVFHEAFAQDPAFSLIYANCDMREILENDVKDYEREFDVPGRKF